MSMEHRLYGRQSCDVPVSVEVPGGNSYVCRVRDICRDGMSIENASLYLRHGSFVKLADPHERGRLGYAVVVHSREGRAGLFIDGDVPQVRSFMSRLITNHGRRSK